METFKWKLSNRNYFWKRKYREQLGQITAKYGERALLVTTSQKGRTSWVYERAKEILEAAGVTWGHFDKVTPNPVTDIVTERGRTGKGNGCESDYRHWRRLQYGHSKGDCGRGCPRGKRMGLSPLQKAADKSDTSYYCRKHHKRNGFSGNAVCGNYTYTNKG